MATSGSTDYNRTRNEIITRSLRVIGVLATGQTASAAQISEGSDALNSLVKSLQSDGVRLWSLDWITKTLTASSQVTGTDSKNYTCIRNHTAAASNRPITGADYSSYWIQRGSTGIAWVTATAYTSINEFTFAADTIGIEKATARYNETDHPLELVPFEKYFNEFSTKGDSSTIPTVLAVQYTVTLRAFLYPHPDSTTPVIQLLRVRKLEDFDASANNPDFVTRWMDTLVWGLAHRMSYEYQLPLNERISLRNEYEASKRTAKMGDREIESFPFVKSAYRSR